MRLVSLTCSNTEIVCALGRDDWLVGVDDHSDYPEDVVSRLARVGKDLNVDPERVAALKPDLVLASLTVPGHDKVVASLEALDLPLEVFQPFSLEDTFSDILRMGELLDATARAEALHCRYASTHRCHSGRYRVPPNGTCGVVAKACDWCSTKKLGA